MRSIRVVWALVCGVFLLAGLIQAAEIQRLKDSLNEILAEHTGQKLKKIVEDSDRDYFMSSEEAKDYGLVDDVVKSRKEVTGLKGEKKNK